MAQKKEDRRVRMTKWAIRDSLVEWMQEYPISKISVKMICERADVNRSTFYAHYSDQFDLLKKVQQEVVEGFKDQVSKMRLTSTLDATTPILEQILEYARSNAALFRVLLSENGDSTFQNELISIAQQKTLGEIRADRQLDESTAAYLETFAISGYISVMRRWLERGCIDETAPLAELMTRLLFQGIMSIYPE